MYVVLLFRNALQMHVTMRAFKKISECPKYKFQNKNKL